MFQKYLSIIIFMFALSACDSGGGSSTPSTNSTNGPPASSNTKTALPVSLAPQQTEVWCWAAVIEMVSSYYGNHAYQCQTLSYWYGADCCNFPGYCVTAGTDYQIQESLNQLGMSSTFNYSPLSWNQVVNEIDAGRPFIIFYQGSFSGHVVVVYGYDSSRQTMLIHDPYFGSFEVPYGQTFTYNGSLYWARTLFQISRYF